MHVTTLLIKSFALINKRIKLKLKNCTEQEDRGDAVDPFLEPDFS